MNNLYVCHVIYVELLGQCIRCHLDIIRMAHAKVVAYVRNSKVLRIIWSTFWLFQVTPTLNCPLPLPGGPSPAPLHPKRSPTSTGEAELKEERLPGRKASCSAAGSGSRGLPPSSPMVSSAHNPNKAEIPERRKDSTSTPVSGGAGGWDQGCLHLWPSLSMPPGSHFSDSAVSHPVPQTTTWDSLFYPFSRSLNRHLLSALSA